MRSLSMLAGWLVVASLLPLVHAAPPAITLTQVVSGASNPISIHSAKDDSSRLFIVERTGRIRVMQNGQLLATNFLNIATQIQASGSQGLLGLAFDPGYKTNGHFFVYHTNNNGSSNVIARYTANPPGTNQVNVATRAEVLRIPHLPFNNHNGGHLQFGPDGYLYAATGDGGFGAIVCDPNNNAQNLNVLGGKLLRIDVRTPPYVIPPDNPFAGLPGHRGEIWAYGLRHPWRFSFDRLTGDLFLADVGEDTREEVNFQPASSTGGENYGWRCFEGSLTNTCGLVCSNYPSVRPVLEYGHTAGNCSINGGYRYRGNQFPPLAGYYLYSDYCTGRIWAASPDANGVWSTTQLVITPTPSPALNSALVGFGEDEAGELYVVDVRGRIHKIVAVDTDKDGLPDWFEQQYFGTPTNAVAGVDADGDGQTNLEEFLAGTNPVEAASALRITRTERIGDAVELDFPSVLDRRYRVEWTPDILVPPTNVLTNNISGTGGVLTVFDPTAASATNRFYRVRLLP